MNYCNSLTNLVCDKLHFTFTNCLDFKTVIENITKERQQNKTEVMGNKESPKAKALSELKEKQSEKKRKNLGKEENEGLYLGKFIY